MELTQQQKTILESTEPKIFVSASAAALKTTTLTEKARQLLRAGVEPNRIAVITFTRMAAEELIQRLGEDYKDGIFVGTIHSLAAHFLSKNGKGKLIKGIAEEEEFDKLFEECRGLNVYKSFDWVLLDEAQDSGKLELEFIFDMIAPDHFFVVADFKQSIYGFKDARPDLLKRYMNGIPTYPLDYNFRNGEDILDYARRIVKKTGLIDNSTPLYGSRGRVIETTYDEEYLCELIENSWSYKDWAILTRTNAQIEFLGKVLKKHGIPFNTFKQGDLNKSQLEKKLEENKVKLITIHSAKGLGFRNVVVYGAVWWNKDEYFLNYVAATRAMDLLVWMKPEYKKRKRS